MTDRTLSQPILVTKYSALENLAETLLAEKVIAVDTESNSLYAYQEQVCLIQFSTPGVDYLVDPICIRDLTPLENVFASMDVEKVFHAAEYDLICLKRDFGFDFSNLFDTMIAAGILGYSALGLGSILKRKFGVQINKRYQRANWGERPLPNYLKKYAQQDTHYLIALRDQFHRELISNNLQMLAQEDFERLCRVKLIKTDAYIPGDVEKNFWRVNGSSELDPQNAAVLLELCRYRDKVARKTNKPLFKVLSDQTLFVIAEQLPRNIGELRSVPGMSNHQIRRHGSNLLFAVRKGLESRPVYPPKRPRANGRYLNRVDCLKRWRKTTAQKMGVNPDVVLSKDLLCSVAKKNPGSLDELLEIFDQFPWRMEKFGEQIIAELKEAT